MKFKYLNNEVTLKLNVNKCIGCGLCKIVCPHRVFNIIDEKAIIAYRNRCIECGACASNCPVKAINVNAGVGCAAAILNDMIGSKKNCC